MFVVLAGSASAVTTPNAGGSRSVNEDTAYWYNGTDGSGTATSYTWDFAGTLVFAQNTQYTFNTPGTNTVKFWADDGLGSNVSDTITVTVLDITAPTANAGGNQNVNEDTVVNLDASNSTDNDPNFATTGKYYWTFSDNGVSISKTGKTQTYTFATPGTYTVNLLVIDAAGNFASSIMTVTVKDITAPTGSGTVPASANEDTSVAFSSAAITDNDPNFATTRRDYWTFTDGTAQNLSGTSQSHTFNTPGTYSVTLTVMDAAGNKLTAVFSINIVDTTAPTGSGTVPATANEDTVVAFSSASITDNDPSFGSNRRDYWTFTDGAAKNLSGTAPTYTFNTPGSFVITLTVMDNTGNKLTATFTIVIKDTTAPTGLGTVPASSNEDVAVAFSSTAITDNDPNFAASRRDYWTFTDGVARNLSGSSQSYTFNTPGTFAITLTVMDSAGNMLTQLFSITIRDVTAPVPTIGAGSLGQSREQYSAVSFTGTTVDNVLSTNAAWIFTNSTGAQNLTCSSATSCTVSNIVFSTTGTFLIRFWVRDAAFNEANAFTNITVFADATPPTVTWVLYPLTGDDQTALTYSATAVDNAAPTTAACAASCNWTWSKDGVQFAWGVQSVIITWTPGPHTLTLAVRDLTVNTRITSQTVNIDQLVQTSTTLDLGGGSQSMNWNLRIINGATYLIRNSIIYNSTLGITTTVNVTNGRLILENSSMISNSSSIGFKIYATGVNGTQSYLYFNNSRVSGLFDWITIWQGTLSARNSNFDSQRLNGAGLIWGIDSNIYLNNVTVNSITVFDGAGVRANYTSQMTLFQYREVVLDTVTATAVPQVPFAFGANSMTGTVNVTLRSSTFKSSAPLDGSVRGTYFYFGSSSGVFNLRLATVQAGGNTYGGLYAINSQSTGRISWNITDSVFGGSAMGDGMYFLTRGALANTSWFMYNVSSQRNLCPIATCFGVGTGLYFAHTDGGNNLGSVWIENSFFNNNTRDGIYSFMSDTRTAWTWQIRGSDMSYNRNGLYFDWNRSWGTYMGVWIDPSTINYNQMMGINFVSSYQIVNVSFDLTDVQVDHNNIAGVYMDEDHGTSSTQCFPAPVNCVPVFSRQMYGNVTLNLTRSSISWNNGRGLWAYDRNGNQNWSGRWTDSNIDHNGGEGIFFDAIVQSYYYSPQYWLVERNVTIFADRTSVSFNGRHGIYTTEQTSGVYNGNQISSSVEYDFYFNNSHIDRNALRGVYWNNQYGQYSATLMHLWIREGSTVSNNGGSGIFLYQNSYSYAWIFASTGRGRPDNVVHITNSTVAGNGFTQSDGYGIHLENIQLYGAGDLRINISGSAVSGNAATGVDFYNPGYGYQPQGFTTRVINSHIDNNGGRGVHTYYYYLQQAGGVSEWYENSTFNGNGAEPYYTEYGQSYARYSTPWNVVFLNNTFDRSSTTAISTGVSYVYNYIGMGGPEVFNFTGNKFTNITGAAVVWSFSPPADSQTITVDFNNNYVADTQDGVQLAIQGQTNDVHRWTVTNNTFERTQGSALLLAMTNAGAGNTGTLQFQQNIFRQTGGIAFTLTQSNIKMQSLLIKDCTFDTQRTGISLSGIVGTIDHATFIASVKNDVELQDGLLEIHNTPIDPAKLKPIGTAAAFNVWFHLKVFVVWSGTGKPVVGAVAQYSDAAGSIFFVATVADSTGLPEMELWSYTKSAQGVLGRTPFTVDVTYFEIEQATSIDLYQDKIVTIEVRDDVVPTIVISNPKDGFGTQGDTIQLDGTTYDSQSGFAFDINDPQLPAQYVEVSSDNATWTTVHVKSSSAFEVQFDYTFTGLTESVTALYVRSHDDANNYITRVIPVKVDHTPPVVRILSPTSSSLITNKDTLTLSAETEVGALIFVNGLTPPVVFTRPDGVTLYFTMEIPVFEGPNTITVVAIDALNNQGNASVFALVDRQAPYLAVIKPDVSALVNSTTLTVVGQTERTGVTVTVNGLAATVDPQGNFTRTVQLTSDFNRVEILATDLAGNTQLVVREVRYDNTPPWINVQSPANNALLNSPEVDVIGIVEPGAKLIVNDEVVSAPTGAFSRRFLLTEGTNSIQFVAIDPAGNYGYRTVFVTVDTIKPTINLVGPANESLVNTQNVLVSGNVTDEHSVSLLVGGQEIAVNTDGTFSVTAPLYEGTNFITLEARDGAGNSNIKVLTVVSDTTAPFLLPELEGTFIEGVQVMTYNSTVTVKGYAEKGSVVEVCYEAPIGNTSVGLPVCNAIPLAADGSFRTFVDVRKTVTNTITVTATDAAGNSLSRQLQVYGGVQPVPPPPPTNYGLYGLYALGIAILGGAFFLLYMRRGKGGQPMELSGAEPMPYYPQGPTDMPPQMGGELGAVQADVTSAPEVAGDVAVTTAPDDDPFANAPAPEESPTMPPEGEGMVAPGDDVPSAASRPRPMRRRPLGGADGGAEGGALTGMGAEEEAQPGDTHQDEAKEG